MSWYNSPVLKEGNSCHCFWDTGLLEGRLCYLSFRHQSASPLGLEHQSSCTKAGGCDSYIIKHTSTGKCWRYQAQSSRERFTLSHDGKGGLAPYRSLFTSHWDWGFLYLALPSWVSFSRLVAISFILTSSNDMSRFPISL